MARMFNEPLLIGATIRAILLALIALEVVKLTDQQIAAVMIAVEAVLTLVTRAFVTPNHLAEARVDAGGRPSIPMEKNNNAA